MPAGIAVPAILDHGHIHIDDVSRLSSLSLGMPWQTWWLIEVQMALG